MNGSNKFAVKAIRESGEIMKKIFFKFYISNLLENSNFYHLFGTIIIGVILQPVIFSDIYKGMVRIGIS